MRLKKKKKKKKKKKNTMRKENALIDKYSPYKGNGNVIVQNTKKKSDISQEQKRNKSKRARSSCYFSYLHVAAGAHEHQ